MDLNDGKAEGELSGAAAVDALIEVPVVVDPGEALRRARDAVMRRRRAMTEAFLGIVDTVEDVRAVLAVSKLRAFLVSECGVDRADVKTYLKFTEALGEHRETIASRDVAFATIKAMVAAPEPVRREVIERIELGSFVHAGDVAAIRRSKARQDEPPALAAERRRQKALRAAAEQKAQSGLEAFCAEFRSFAKGLVDFYNRGIDGTIEQSDYAATRASLTGEAARCLSRFEVLFDVTALPAAWEYHLDGHDEDAVRLARTGDALRSLAAGDLKTIEPDSGNPVDRSHAPVDRWIAESIAWMFDDRGIATEALKQPRTAAVVARPTHVRPPSRLSSLEICAGAGGQALGLHAAGFDALYLYEQDKYAAATLEANGGLGIVRRADIKKVDFSHLRGMVDLVAGGVPCQPHSRQGKQRHAGDERDLFGEAVRIVDEVRPRAFFFENVEGFASRGNADQRAELYDRFRSLGYESQVFSISGSDLGLPQERKRVAFVGFRDVPLHRFRLPPKLPHLRTTIGEALLDLVAADGWEGAEDWAATKGAGLGLTIIGGSKQTGRYGFASWWMFPRWEELGIDAVEIAAEPPSSDHPRDGSFRLTLEMAARLQGFPDGWPFQDPSSRKGETAKYRPHIKRQIANALPPVMARAIGLSIYAALTGTEFDWEKALRQPIEVPHATGLKLAVHRRVQEHRHRKLGADEGSLGAVLTA